MRTNMVRVRTNWTAPLSREPFLPMLRELARCYQAFEAYSGAHVRALGLTPWQAFWACGRSSSWRMTG